jgi:Periplasmic copper-binding protein (NosD)
MTLGEKKSFGGAKRVRHALWIAVLMMMAIAGATAQGIATTTVQGTVYLANGQTGTGTLVVKWPAFTTAEGQAVAADSLTSSITADGFVSVQLAPNQGATPAGLYYTAVYYMSDGSTSTEYWVVPAGTQATLAQVRSQVMPAAQAVQAVSKAYVDEKVSELTQSLLTASGGSLSGPLFLNGDPSQPLQATDKHYVDSQVATALPLSGGTMTGVLNVNGDPTQDMQAASKHYVDAAAANAWPGMVLRADQFAGADFGARLQACVNAVDATYGGTCDARNFAGTLGMAANLTIATANTAVLLPCATIATSNQIVVAAGTRNVALRGCALRGGSQSSGSAGGTVFAYSGTGAMVQVGDTTYAEDTPGFHMDNVVVNTTAAASASAQGLAAYRTQELDLESLYLLGNANQTGMTLDGTGNYTGGTFMDVQVSGFQTAVNAIGHQVANAAATDWVNASTFVRLHINCPTADGSPIPGTYGINLQQGDGNTFTGGDVEGCGTALHLGSNAQNNTIVGLRNENSTKQVVADAGSAYNNWITGGTMFTGQLTDNGTRNSFLDTFHRSFNALNGDWYGSQQDATLVNHYRLGTGAGNERGLQDRYQTDSGYRWTMGLTDATAGEQYYQILDELNNVNRFSVGQYNSGQASTNNQTVINAAGIGAVVLNGSNNAGTGGVVIGSGGASSSTVATISNAGNAQFNGTLQVGGTAQSSGTMTVRNNADAEVDYYLWPGLTASQKGSFTYKDFNGNSQWYMVKDQNNNWALNSAVGGLDSFKAYQSTNSGDTYINASNASGAVRVNYEAGAGSSFKVYGGNSSTLYASFTGVNAIAFPGLAAASGQNCVQIDSSGYLSNTGAACGSGGSGTVGTGSTGQIAYYTANGASIGGTSMVPLTAGGTGATTAATALQNLGALAANGCTTAAGGNLTCGTVAAATTLRGQYDLKDAGAKGDGSVDTTAIHAAFANAQAAGKILHIPAGDFQTATPIAINTANFTVQCDGIMSHLYTANGNAVLQIEANGVKINNCSLENQNPVSPTSNVVIGIYGSGISDVAIRGNFISGGAGIYSTAGVNLAATNMQRIDISGNTIAHVWAGVHGPPVAGSLDPKQVTITDNKMYDLTGHGVTLNYPIQNLCCRNPPIAVTAFSITSNTVTLTGSNSLSVNDQFAASGLTTGNYLNGVRFTVTSATGTTFTGTATGFTHADTGLTSDSGTVQFSVPQYTAGWNFSIARNQIEAEEGSLSSTIDGFGIAVAGADYVQIDGNQIKSRQEGIHIEDNAAQVSVTNNTIYETLKNPCMMVYGSDHITVTGNQLRNCKDEGIWVTEGTDPTGYNYSSKYFDISHNMVSKCGHAGIRAETGFGGLDALARITDNTVTSCNNGFQIDDALKMSEFDGNTAVSNIYYGLELNAGQTNSAFYLGRNNHFEGNGSSDIDFPTSGAQAIMQGYQTVATGFTANPDTTHQNVYAATGLNLGKYAEGTITVSAANKLSNHSMTSYSYHISWNGTTLVATESTSAYVKDGYIDRTTPQVSAGGFLKVGVWSTLSDASSLVDTINFTVTFSGVIGAGGDTAATIAATSGSTTPNGTGVPYWNGTAYGASLPAPQTALMFAYGSYNSTASTIVPVQNKVTLFGFTLPTAINLTHISYYVQTADNTSNSYDIGIYSLNSAGTTATLVADVGAQPGTAFAPSSSSGSNPISLAVTTPVLLTSGTYIMALTTNCASACAVLDASSSSVSPTTLVNTTGAGSTTGGALTSYPSITGLAAGAKAVATFGFLLY